MATVNNTDFDVTMNADMAQAHQLLYSFEKGSVEKAAADTLKRAGARVRNDAFKQVAYELGLRGAKPRKAKNPVTGYKHKMIKWSGSQTPVKKAIKTVNRQGSPIMSNRSGYQDWQEAKGKQVKPINISKKPKQSDLHTVVTAETFAPSLRVFNPREYSGSGGNVGGVTAKVFGERRRYPYLFIAGLSHPGGKTNQVMVRESDSKHVPRDNKWGTSELDIKKAYGPTVSSVFIQDQITRVLSNTAKNVWYRDFQRNLAYRIGQAKPRTVRGGGGKRFNIQWIDLML